MKKERHIDRNHQVIPLRVRHLEVSQKLSAPGDATILAPGHSVEEGGAGFAGAEDLSRGDLNQVRMLMRHGQAAQLAAFDRASGTRKLAKGRECLI
jgi:hypothetical protein